MGAIARSWDVIRVVSTYHGWNPKDQSARSNVPRSISLRGLVDRGANPYSVMADTMGPS